jgi:hypothetical protein
MIGEIKRVGLSPLNHGSVFEFLKFSLYPVLYSQATRVFVAFQWSMKKVWCRKIGHSRFRLPVYHSQALSCSMLRKIGS